MSGKTSFRAAHLDITIGHRPRAYFAAACAVGIAFSLLMLAGATVGKTVVDGKRFPEICQANDGANIPNCPESCMGTCDDRSFISLNPAVLNSQCAKMNRKMKDQPSCNTPPAASARQCLVKARSATPLIDKINKRGGNEEDRKSDLEFFKGFPTCLPDPAALDGLMSCIKDAATDITAKFKDIQAAMPDFDQYTLNTSAGRAKFCRSALPILTGKPSRDLQETQTEAEALTTDFTSTMDCSEQIQTWVESHIAPQQAASPTEGNKKSEPRNNRAMTVLKAILYDLKDPLDRIKGIMTSVREASAKIRSDRHDIDIICPDPPAR